MSITKTSRLHHINQRSANPIALECSDDSGNVSSTITLQNEYRCALCGVNCPTKAETIRHLAVTHDKLQQTTQRSKFMYECPTCGVEFSDLSVFKTHLMRYQRRQYNCLKCPKVYGQRDRLEKHYRNEHGIRGPDSYKCEEWDGIYHLYLKHRKYHDKPTLACPDCPALFYSKMSLHSHARFHNSKAVTQIAQYRDLSRCSRFGCAICSRVFPIRCLLQKHINTHNPTTFSCANCHFLCHVKAILHRHLQRYHEAQLG